MFRKFFTVIVTAGVLIGGVLFISLLGQLRPKIERQTPEITPPTVFYTIATPQAVTLDVAAQGEVRPRTDITLTTQVAGKVQRTSDAFVNGGAFNKGDLLIKIEDPDYRYAVTSAKSRVAQARELLAREQAEADLAQQDFEELGGDITASDLTLRKPQLAQARANYNAALADLQTAELNLERTNIKAPFQGRVRERSIGPGQYVTPGAQLGRVFSTDVAEIRLPLSDADLAKLGLPLAFVATENDPGPAVELSAVLAGRLHSWEGHIARTDGAIDPSTRQISAIAVVEDPYGVGADNGTPLAIGLYVDAKIEGRPYEGAYVLPRTALYGRDRIYVVGNDDLLDERQVSVVSSDRDTVTIAVGLNGGERVATSPLRGAGEGDKVAPEAALPTLISGMSTATTAGDAAREDAALAQTRSQVTQAAASVPAPTRPSRDTTAPDGSEETADAPVEETSERRYLPGEVAPNDEIADDLNRRQLSEEFPSVNEDDGATTQTAASGETL